MEPYYQDDAVTIYCGDAREVMPTLPQVDAVITDPPYGVKKGAAFVRLGGADIAERGDAVENVLCEGWEAPAAALVRAGGYIAAFHKQQDVLTFPGMTAWHRFYIIKQAPAPTPRPVFQSAVEECSIHRKPGKGYWGGGGATPNYWRGMTPNQRSKGHGHEFEKPIEPMGILIRCLVAPGGTVVDSFMGVGPTLRAAKDLGRKAIGIEINEGYCEIAARRMAQEVLFQGVGS